MASSPRRWTVQEALDEVRSRIQPITGDEPEVKCSNPIVTAESFEQWLRENKLAVHPCEAEGRRQREKRKPEVTDPEDDSSTQDETINPPRARLRKSVGDR